MKLTIDGWHCQQFMACEFQRAVNDGNLTAAIDAWMDLNGYFIPEFSYSIGADQAADEQPDGWTVETGDDGDGSTIVHEIDVTSGVHSLYLKDTKGMTGGTGADTPKQMILSYLLPVDIVEGKVLRIKGKFLTCTGGSANCYLGIQLNEGTTVGAHLGLYLVNGLIYYSTDDTETTTADMTTTGVTATVSVAGTTGYIWVKMENIGASSTFKIAYTTNNTDTPSYSSAFAMANDLTAHVDTLLIYTPDVNDDGGVVTPESGLDKFDTYGADGTAIDEASGPIGDWDYQASPVCLDDGSDTDFTKETLGGDTCGYLYHSGAANFLMRTFCLDTPKNPTDLAPAEIEIAVYRHTIPAGADCPIFWFCYGNNYDQRKVDVWCNDDGKIYYYGAGSAVDTGVANPATGSWTTWTFQLKENTFRFSLDGGSTWNGWYSNSNRTGSTSWGANTFSHWLLGGYGAVTKIYFDDIKPAWTYVAASTVYTAKTLEAYLYELWSDQGFITPSDARGRQVDLWQADNHVWRGFIHEVEKGVTAAGGTIARLKCYDEFYPCGQEDIAISNLRHSTTLLNPGGVTLNELTLTDAVGDKSKFNDAWALVRHNAGQIEYDKDSDATYESLDTSAYISGTNRPGDVTITETNTHAKTALKDNDFHVLTIDFTVADAKPVAYLEYTLDRVTPSGRTPVAGKIMISGKASWQSGLLGYQYATVYAYNKDTTDWDNVGTLGQAPGSNIGYVWEVPFTNSEFPLKAVHVEETGGNWQVKIRIYINTNDRFVECDWYFDYIRVHVTASKDISYIPIEAPIDTIDDVDVIDINSIPIAAQNAADGDALMIAKSIPAAIGAALILLSGVTVNMGEPFGCHPVDYRGDDGFSAFKRTCQACGIDWYLDVDEDGDNSVLHCGDNKAFWSAHRITTGTEIQNVTGWGRESTRSHRVTVERTNQVGSYLRFPHDFAVADNYHDTVYMLLSSDLDTAATRDLKSIDLYFSIGGTALGAGDTRNLLIQFMGTNNPDGGSSPYVYLYYINLAGTFYWKMKLYGDAGSSDLETVETDANGTMGIRVVFDRDAGTVRGYKREIILDTTRKLADTWAALGNQDDCTFTEDAARSICFSDASASINMLAASYINLHQIHIEFEPETTSGGTITCRGDITDAVKEDRVKSLTVYGGKDADGNELKHTVDVDTVGYNKVELLTSMTSLAELRRYCENLVDNYESDKVCIRMNNYTVQDSEDFVFHVGWYYTFTLDGTTYTEQLRRATCKAKAESPVSVTWDLEFGQAHTTGAERLREAGFRMTSDVKELKRK